MTQDQEIHGATIIMCYTMIQQIDALQNTSFYLKGVKHHANNLLKQLDRPELTRMIDGGYNGDSPAFNNITSHFEGMFKIIARFGMDQMSLLSIAAQKIAKDPEAFRVRNGLQIGSSKDIELMKKREFIKDKINALNLYDLEYINKYINNLSSSRNVTSS